jgi:superfamily II DNA helicase RecQ
METMREYVLSRRCRRRILLGYLGEEISTRAACDRCTKGGLPWPVTFGRFAASSNGFCSRVILTRLLKQAHVRSARAESKQGEGQSARPELVAADGRGCFTPGTTCKNSTSVLAFPPAPP